MPTPRKNAGNGATEKVEETTDAPLTVDGIRKSIADRLAELRPIVAEANKLEGALAALEAAEKPRRGRPPGSGRSVG